MSYFPKEAIEAMSGGTSILDTDLTLIALLETTPFGRHFLELVDAAEARAKLELGSLSTQSGTFSGSSSGTNTGDQFTAMTASRLLGRVSAGFGPAEQLTAAQATAMLDLATAAAKGLMSAADKAKLDGLSSSGGADPWTTRALAADYTQGTATFATISDGTNALTYTPPANVYWELEARLLVWTTAAANLPRVGVNIAAGAAAGYGCVNVWQAGATATASVHVNGGWNNPATAQNFQIPAGGLLTASVPYLCEVIASGRSGATPTAISLQMACETAAANTCFIKRGSFLKTRSGF